MSVKSALSLSLFGISPSSSCSWDPDAEVEAEAADLEWWMLAWSWWDSNLRKSTGVVVYHALDAVDDVVVALLLEVVVVRHAVAERVGWSRVQRRRLFVVARTLPAARLKDDDALIMFLSRRYVLNLDPWYFVSWGQYSVSYRRQRAVCLVCLLFACEGRETKRKKNRKKGELE